jgi:F0F1-type ATP synthase assembly protein I
MVGVGASFANESVIYTLVRWLPLLFICGLACTNFPRMWAEKAKQRFRLVEGIAPVATILLFLVCVAYMVNDTFSPFCIIFFDRRTMNA